jgi:hypothetical protein
MFLPFVYAQLGYSVAKRFVLAREANSPILTPLKN